MLSTRSIVVITGTTQGIGFVTAKLIAKTNTYTVILTSRNAKKAEVVLNSIVDSGGVDADHIFAVHLDVQYDTSVLSAAKHINDTFGILDILINNAGRSQLPCLRSRRTASYEETAWT